MQNEKYNALKERFGFSSFREGQEEVIDAVLEGKNILAVMPTGSGKSLCYQLPALIYPGVTLVISPLIALMKDQVDSLNLRRIPATFINSSLSWDEQKVRLRGMEKGRYKLVYIAPERFRADSFGKSMMQTSVSLFVVDEAHCISQWGHDFRPDYLSLKEACQKLGSPHMIALTATATPEVQQDIICQLQMQNPSIFVSGFNRENLNLEVKPVSSREDKLEKIRAVISQWKGPGIIYAATQKNAEWVFSSLSDLSAGLYHGGMSNGERTRIQDAFKSGRIKIIVATNAFGMGVDKPDIRFIIHFDIPGSIEAYYQEIGRAGRDGKTAICLLLFNHSDTYIQQFFIDNSNPSRELIESLYKQLWNRGTIVIEETYQAMSSWIGAREAEVFSVLKILEHGGYIKRLARPNHQATIRLLLPLESALGRIPFAPNQWKRFLWELRGIFGGELEIGIDITLQELSYYTQFSEDEMHSILIKLHENHVIQYIPPSKDKGIALIGEGPVQLRLDWDVLAKKKERDQAKLQEMIQYSYHRECRKAKILRYFGDLHIKETCHSCDNCLNMSLRETLPILSGEDKTTVIKVLSCVARMNGRFGKTTVAKVLKGSRSGKLRDNELTSLSTYGILSSLSLGQITKILDALIEAGCCEVIGIEYPTIHISPFGRDVMLNKAEVRLKLYDSSSSQDQKQADESTDEQEDDEKSPKEPPVDKKDNPELYEKLRELRRELAGNMPAYIVAHNRVLEEMISKRPATLEELLKIKGVGQSFIQKYGQAFLELINTDSGIEESTSYEELKEDKQKGIKDIIKEDHELSPTPTERPITSQTPSDNSDFEEADTSSFSQDENELYEKLRKLRRDLAGGAPAFTIAHNRVLEEMILRKPRTPEELIPIKGIGPHFIEQYGRAFLDVINGEREEDKKKETHDISLESFQGDLYTKLIALREYLAKDAPVYSIIPTRTLYDMAQIAPDSPEELLKIKGVSRRFMINYGELFLQMIRMHRENAGNPAEKLVGNKVFFLDNDSK